MSLKTRLFGPEWRGRDAVQRARAVATAADPELFEALPGIATSDPQAEVRLAALRRMNDESAWRQAHRDDPADSVRDAARHALLQRLLETEDDTDNAARVAWLIALDDREALKRAARKARSSALRGAVLETLSAPGFLGDCAVTEADDELAEALIRRIEQVSTLERIAPELKKRSKRRHQALLKRLNTLAHGESGPNAGHQARLQLVAQAERLARGELRGDRRTLAETLHQQWQALASDADAALSTRFEGAMRIVEQALAAPAERPPTRPEPERESAPALPAELLELAERATALATRALDDESAAALNPLISSFDRFRNQHPSPDPAMQAEFTRIQALIGELQARIEARRSVAPPATAESHDEPATEPAAGASQDARPDPGASIQPLLEQAGQTLDEGNLQQAWSLLGQARRAIDKLDAKRRPHKLVAELGRLNARLREMRDWLHWSNNELRERLIERVGEIDVEQLHPDAVTARLKELRGRWSELETAERMPGDKRRNAAPQGQWRRFQKACQQAFDAARPYLEQRSEAREQSLTDLKQFIDQARAVLADEARGPDDLLRYQRAAREGIRNLDAVPPRKRGEMATALRKLMDKLSARLDEHFRAAEDEKRRLIAEARKLAHESDRARAIDQAKALQAEWKKAGRGRRKVDDKLWREFREPIDPLFEDLKKERDQRSAEQTAQREAMNALCEQAEALADADDPVEAGGRLAGVRDELSALGRLPPAIQKRFDQALAQHRDKLSEARQADTRQRQSRLAELAETVQAAWAAMLDGHTLAEASPETPTDETGADGAGDESARLLHERLAALRAAASSEALAQRFAKHAEAAREVVIEMECISGLETPAVDKDQRMAVQVRRLSERLGHGSARPDLGAEREQLRRRWLASFPRDPDVHKELDRRYREAERILDQMSRGG
ncbi:MAG: DUF349 domain-containing protein [Wenzhouxiangellaceae bacterium]|nr:DUF349 domain-containing protein [Wenzhouxiangellaceae bacterium]